MTGGVSAAAVSAVTDPDPAGFDHVLAGVRLVGPAARLAAMLEVEFLATAGWDPAARVLSLPAAHPLLGRRLCRVGGCLSTTRGTTTGGLCGRCITRLTGQGMTEQQIASSAELVALPPRPGGCAVPGCQRMPPSPRGTLCDSHRHMWRRRPGTGLEQFLADPAVAPLPALRPCLVEACTQRSESGHRYCSPHYQRWRQARAAEPGTNERLWQLTCSAVCQGGQVSLRGLAPLVVVEVLFGVQQRVHDGAKVTEVALRAVCDTLRREQTPTIAACRVECVPGAPARSLAVMLARHVRRALTDPGRERAGQVWDLGVFGHHGRLSFAGISQPWLAQAAKAWAGEQLPRHRRSGAKRVRASVNAVARLSESLVGATTTAWYPSHWAALTSKRS